MKRLLFILIFLPSLVFSQSGGVGFWGAVSSDPPEPPVGHMYNGFFLVNRESGVDFAYMLPLGGHALVRYQVNPSLANGTVIYGSMNAIGDLEYPTEIKESNGHLFILDKYGTRITRINLSNFSDTEVVFNNSLSIYPLKSFVPYWDGVGAIRLFGIHYNPSSEAFYRSNNPPNSLYPSYDGIAGRTRSVSLISEIIFNTPVLRAAVNDISVSFGNIGYVSAGIYTTTEGGGLRIAVTSATNIGSGTYIWTGNVDADLCGTWTDGRLCAFRSTFYEWLSRPFNEYIISPLTPSINIGNNRGVLKTSYFDGAGAFTSIRWEDGSEVTYGAVNTRYWSPILGSTSNDVYAISGTSAGYVLRRLLPDGNTVTVRLDVLPSA